MARLIRITIGGVVGEAELLDDLAPTAVKALWDSLPLSGTINQSIWCGTVVAFDIGWSAALPSILEHPVSSIYPGAIVVSPLLGQLLIGYGGMGEVRSDLGLHYGTRVGKLTQERSSLLEALAGIHKGGAVPMLLERMPS